MAKKCPYEEVAPQMEQLRMQGQQGGLYEEDGISLRELILVLIRGKKTILAVAAVVMVVAVLGAFVGSHANIGTRGTVQTALQLYFSGIEIGQNPTGGVYDVNEIKSAEVLKNALNNIDFGKKHVSIEALKNNITFQAVIPDDVAKTLENLKEIKNDEVKMAKLDSLEGHSNTFIVELNLDNSLGIDKEQGRIILDNIILEYKKQLIEKYGDTAVLANVFASDLNLKQYDYIQAANILDDQLNRMESFVGNHMPQTGTNSTVTGLNPADISSALKSIRTVDMEGIYTNIAAFYLTKDPGQVVAIYEQMAEDKEKEAAQYSEEAAEIKAAIVNFKKDKQTIVMGQMGSEGPITLTGENKQYNKFVSQYIEAGTNSVNAAEDARYYRAEAERFRTALPLTGENSEEAADTESRIELLEKKLTHWTKVINDTAADYNEEAAYQHYAEQLMPARSYEALEEGPSLPMVGAIGLVAGLVLGMLVILFQAYVKEEGFVRPVMTNRKEEREVACDENE